MLWCVMGAAGTVIMEYKKQNNTLHGEPPVQKNQNTPIKAKMMRQCLKHAFLSISHRRIYGKLWTQSPHLFFSGFDIFEKEAGRNGSRFPWRYQV